MNKAQLIISRIATRCAKQKIEHLLQDREGSTSVQPCPVDWDDIKATLKRPLKTDEKVIFECCYMSAFEALAR